MLVLPVAVKHLGLQQGKLSSERNDGVTRKRIYTELIMTSGYSIAFCKREIGVRHGLTEQIIAPQMPQVLSYKLYYTAIRKICLEEVTSDLEKLKWEIEWLGV